MKLIENASSEDMGTTVPDSKIRNREQKFVLGKLSSNFRDDGIC